MTKKALLLSTVTDRDNIEGFFECPENSTLRGNTHDSVGGTKSYKKGTKDLGKKKLEFLQFGNLPPP